MASIPCLFRKFPFLISQPDHITPMQLDTTFNHVHNAMFGYILACESEVLVTQLTRILTFSHMATAGPSPCHCGNCDTTWFSEGWVCPITPWYHLAQGPARLAEVDSDSETEPTGLLAAIEASLAAADQQHKERLARLANQGIDTKIHALPHAPRLWLIPDVFLEAIKAAAARCDACASFIWRHNNQNHILLVDCVSSKVNFLSAGNFYSCVIRSGWHGCCSFSGSDLTVHLDWKGNEKRALPFQFIWHPRNECYLDEKRVIIPVFGPLMEM